MVSQSAAAAAADTQAVKCKSLTASHCALRPLVAISYCRHVYVGWLGAVPVASF